MKKILLFALALLSTRAGHACDACNLFEYSSLERRSYAALFYRYRVFSGYPHLRHRARFFGQERMHEPENDGFQVERQPEDYERYHTWEARYQYTLGRRINLLALLPYNRSDVYYDRVFDFPYPFRDTTLTVSGWGDVTVAADYNVLLYGKATQHNLRPGLAVQLPTGQARRRDLLGDYYDPVIQPGTGGWGLIGRLTYQWLRGQNGLNAAVSYAWRTQGVQRYRHGDAFNVDVMYFWSLPLGGTWQLVPQGGAYYEYSDFHRQAGQRVPLTGGGILLANVGCDVVWERWVLTTRYQQPLFQHLHGEQLGQAGRLNLGLVCQF